MSPKGTQGPEGLDPYLYTRNTGLHLEKKRGGGGALDGTAAQKA